MLLSFIITNSYLNILDDLNRLLWIPSKELSKIDWQIIWSSSVNMNFNLYFIFIQKNNYFKYEYCKDKYLEYWFYRLYNIILIFNNISHNFKDLRKQEDVTRLITCYQTATFWRHLMLILIINMSYTRNIIIIFWIYMMTIYEICI